MDYKIVMLVKTNNIEALATEIAARKDLLTEKDNNKQTLLELAAHNGRWECLKLFLEAGCEVKNSQSLLGLAAHGSRMFNVEEKDILECVELILNAGVDPNEPQEDIYRGKSGEDAGLTPLSIAASNNLAEMVNVLMDRGADPWRQGQKEGSEPLFIACKKKNKKIIKRILNYGEIPKELESKLLVHAAWCGVLQIVKMLLKKKTSSKAELTKALQSTSHPTCARVLLEAGADPNVLDEDGRTPLHTAAFSHSTKLADVLIKGGADISILATSHNGAGQEALGIALRKHSGICDAFIRILISGGLNVNAPIENGMPPICLAASRSNKLGVKQLLKSGADPKASSENGMTAMHYAAKAGMPEGVKMLAEAGADPNSKNGDGETPLHLAVRAKAYEVETVKELIKYGGDASIRNKENELPENKCRKGPVGRALAETLHVEMEAKIFEKESQEGKGRKGKRRL